MILMPQSNWLKAYLASEILIKYIFKEVSFQVLFSRRVRSDFFTTPWTVGSSMEFPRLLCP